MTDHTISKITCTMAQTSEFGFRLANGTQIIHGQGSHTRLAFPKEPDIPGQLSVFSPGHRTDPQHTPAFCGPQGIMPFTTENRMPRHVHMSPDATSNKQRYIVEKIFVIEGVGLAEFGGQVYVIPPKTLVLIGPGVPHTWVACPPGLDLQQLGISGDENVVSEGRFTALFEYEEPTSFFPTAQTETLSDPAEYVKCDDLQSIRFPVMSIDEIKDRAMFVWGREARKL